MKKLSVLFVFLAVSAVLAENAGYDYRAPAEPAQSQAQFGAGASAQAAHYNPAQHNYAQLSHRFVPSPNFPYANDYRNQYRQAQQEYQYNSNYQAQYNGANSNYQNVNYNSYNQFDNGNSFGIQNGQQTVRSNPAYNPSYANVQAQQPVITKHIYFHLPPPDAPATTEPVAAAPAKKTYNIIFIKLPSQKSASALRLQQLINQQAAIDKTLIYVLVKKPETQPVQPVPSKPEVFFVKYKDPRNFGQQVNTGVEQVPILQSNAPGLLPGLVNGNGF